MRVSDSHGRSPLVARSCTYIDMFFPMTALETAALLPLSFGGKGHEKSKLQFPGHRSGGGSY